MNFMTNNIREAHDQMAQFLCPHSLRARADTRNLSFQHSWAKMGALDINSVRYGVPVEIESQFPLDMYAVLMVLQGVVEIENEKTAATLRAGSIFIVNPAEHLRMRLTKDEFNVSFCFPASSLKQYTKSETNIAIAELVEFIPSKTGYNAENSQLVRILKMIYSELRQKQNMLQNPLVGPHLEKALLGLLLSEIPHDKSDLFTQQVPSPIPNYVRRAEAYIGSNYEEPITLDQITNAANVSLRTLQNGFRRFRSTTPMSYLRNYRLDQTNCLLKEAYPQDSSVTKIAVNNGFTHLGKFAKHYKKRFGETPSYTLKSQAAQIH